MFEINIRRTLIAGCVVVCPTAAVSATAYPSWTGFYIGVNAGVGTAQTRGIDPTGFSPGQYSDNGRGRAGGVQAGFNWQFSPNWMAGVEADIGRLGIDRNTILTSEYQTGVEASTYGTLRGRFGYTAGPSLLYVTGGAAFVKLTEQWNYLGNPFVPYPAEPHSSSETARGWTLGGGIEAMLGSNWSARAEYLFIDTGKGAVQTIHADLPEPSPTQLDHTFHVFRFGVNYMFGGTPTEAAPPPVDWRGAYVGLNAGIGMSLATGSDLFGPSTVNLNGTGFTGGAQAGYNWQFGRNVVVGVEADINGLGIDDGHPQVPIGQLKFGVAHHWYGTARGRVGYATGPALIYATGGLAYADATNLMDFINSPQVSSQSRRATGAVFGGGIETSLGGNWSAKLEYLNVDLGGRSKVSDGGPIYHFDDNFQIVRFGLNYRWSTLAMDSTSR